MFAHENFTHTGIRPYNYINLTAQNLCGIVLLLKPN